jgi:eukaryotic-like serine/threonine-protein kinase
VQPSPFQIVTPLGAGGMGEVFRARDTRLNRDVALKMLPQAVAADTDRLARFTREAQLLAALNHPNIAAIHGLEDVQRTEHGPPSRALVLELVEGPTLDERIARAPIALDEALAIAQQIADAVAYAHEQGIIHRDLKPANIKIRPDGVVKVLDFGLAKALGATGMSAAHEVTESPTLSNRETAVGVVLGTAAYMSPEQARGGAVDRRADVWAFGVLLFEMLARRRPFAGATISDTIAAILKDEPDWARLPASTPRPLRRLLSRLLEKDPRKRLRDIGDARLLLDDAAAETDEAGSPGITRKASPLWLRLLPWGLLVAATLTLAAVALWPRAAPPMRSLRFTIEPPDLVVDNSRIPAVSPDGTRLIFSDGDQLIVRALDELEGRRVPGTAGAQYPFWSPDGRQIAYLTRAGLWRLSLDGGAPARIASSSFPRGGRTPGGVWRRDGSIVFASASEGTSMQVVPSTGGDFATLFEPDPATENDFHSPSLLPDGQRMLVVVHRPHDGADTIAVVDGTTRKIVLQLPGSALDCPVYLPSGHLLFARQTSSLGVWAVPFSLERLETTGAPWLVAADSNYPSAGANGLVVYARAPKPAPQELVWLDVQTGRVTPANLGTFSELTGLRLSPDGTRLAVVSRVDDRHQVQVVDLQRGTRVPLGQGEDLASHPAWVDDRTVIYSTDRQRGPLMLRRADAAQPAVTMFPGWQPAIAAGHLVFVRSESGILAAGLWHTTLGPDGRPVAEPTVLLQTPVHEWAPALSPDGTLLAYTSGEAGGAQVILRRYPRDDRRWQVSTGGGRDPVWSSTGRTIYFRNAAGEIFAVDVTRSPEIGLNAPRQIKKPATVATHAGFDVSRDGTRLLLPQRAAGPTSRAALVVVQGWTPGAEAQATSR